MAVYIYKFCILLSDMQDVTKAVKPFWGYGNATEQQKCI
jgi:hypothetical protein